MSTRESHSKRADADAQTAKTTASPDNDATSSDATTQGNVTFNGSIDSLFTESEELRSPSEVSDQPVEYEITEKQEASISHEPKDET